MLRFALPALVLTCGALCGEAMAAIKPVRPNIILIMADDLGWSDIGCYGGEIPTPSIDALARNGLRFTQFYNNAICGPTRAALLTGLHCQQIGHRGDHWNQPTDFSKCMTLGEVLQRSGYRTSIVGKWQERQSPLDLGFHRFYGPMCQGKVSYFHEVQANQFYLDRTQVTLPNDFYLTDALNEHALRFLRESLHDERPFFLYVAQVAPHWPLHARERDVVPHRERYRKSGWDEIRAARFAKQRQAGLFSKSSKPGQRPPEVHDWKTDAYQHWQAERMAVYAAQVASIDRGVGQLLQVLRDSGKEENTLVMFLSDNGAAPNGGLVPSKSGMGFAPGSKNNDWRRDGVPIRPGSGPGNLPGPHDTFSAYGLAWANASNTPLRGTKAEGYEGGVRTPLIVRWPAVIRDGGALTSQPGHVVDFMATFLDICGAEYPAEFEKRKPLPVSGRSLTPIFRGQTRAPHPELCWILPAHSAIRMGRWKGVKPRNEKPWQLYDLEADPTEIRDLAEQEPQRLRTIVSRFDAWKSHSLEGASHRSRLETPE